MHSFNGNITLRQVGCLIEVTANTGLTVSHYKTIVIRVCCLIEVTANTGLTVSHYKTIVIMVHLPKIRLHSAVLATRMFWKEPSTWIELKQIHFQ